MGILDTVNARLNVQKQQAEASKLSPLEKISKAIQVDTLTSNSVLVQKDWAAWNAKEKAGGNNWEHKQVMHEYGAKVRGLGSPTESFNHYVGDSAGNLKKVTPTQFHSAQLPDKTSDSTKEKHINHLASKISQFNRKVDFNSWVKAAPRTHEEKLSKLSSYGVTKEDSAELIQKDWASYDAKKGRHAPAQFNPKNPKIDLHHKETGAYLGSTNWSPNVGHAVANFEEKNKHLNGLVRGFKAK